MFPRYGSYPGFHPIAELSMTFHTQVAGANGQRQAMYIERTEGLAEVILANFQFAPSGRDDRVLGLGPDRGPDRDGDGRAGARPAGRGGHLGRPVDGRASRTTRPARGCWTTRTSSSTCARPAGDALVRLEGLDTPIGPGSTVANAAIVNEIKVQTAAILLEQGALPPVLTSAAVVGPERSAELFEAAYREHARRVARTLAGAEVRRRQVAAERRCAERPRRVSSRPTPGRRPGAPGTSRSPSCS